MLKSCVGEVGSTPRSSAFQSPRAAANSESNLLTIRGRISEKLVPDNKSTRPDLSIKASSSSRSDTNGVPFSETSAWSGRSFSINFRTDLRTRSRSASLMCVTMKIRNSCEAEGGDVVESCDGSEDSRSAT